MPSDPDLAAVIRALRRSAGAPQQAIAERAGIAIATLRRIELARSSPHRATLAAIASALGISVTELYATARARREAS